MAHIKQKCDFCNDPAIYDTKTTLGPWANVCQRHYEVYGSTIPGLFSRLEAASILTKKCIYCDEVKPVSEFYSYTDKRGVQRLRNECKTCNLQERKYQRMKGDR